MAIRWAAKPETSVYDLEAMGKVTGKVRGSGVYPQNGGFAKPLILLVPKEGVEPS